MTKNKIIDYLYNLQKDETEHQNHRLMWILTAQALIFTGLCSLFSYQSREDYLIIIVLIILIGVLISISGIYSMLISKTAIGTVYELWNKYDSYDKSNKNKKCLLLHHMVSLAPAHFLNSKIRWLMFCYFAPNVLSAAWLTLLLMYLSKNFGVSILDKWYYLICLFAVLLTVIVCVSQFMGKHYLYHWGYDKWREIEDGNILYKCDNFADNCDSSCLNPDRVIISRGVGYNGNGLIQNSFNNYNYYFDSHSFNKLNTKCSRLTTVEDISENSFLWKNLKIYHILIDRFYGNINTQMDHNEFMGGTIRGIIEKIDYIKKMGYNAILLTPFFKSNAYHGYHIADFEMIDEHFGNWDDFDELINKLHEKDMRLLCDYVPNHCHISHSFFQSAQKDSSSPYRDWFYFDTSRKGGFVSYQNYPDLPKFNLYNNAASDYLISVAIKLAKRGVDGLRIDHVIGVPFDFLVKLRSKIKEINPRLFLFGEAWFSFLNDLTQVEFISAEQKSKAYKGELTQEEIQLNYVNYLDGVLDFSFRNLLVNELAKVESKQSNCRLLGNKFLYKDIHSHFDKYPLDFQLILFLDNHDTNRFLFRCKGDKSLLKEGLTLCQNFFPNPYTVYYGTERFMMNKSDIHSRPYGDNDVRRPMVWD